MKYLFSYFVYSDHVRCNGGVSKSPSPNLRTTNNAISEYNSIERSPSALQQVTHIFYL